MKRFKLFVKLKFLLIVLVLNVNSHACEENSQALTDIVSDLCYECIFPITISGITLITGPMDDPNPFIKDAIMYM
jgi:hypothetical protein